MEDGAFCGVFDGHGRNGHIVSNIVNSHLSSLILSQKNALAKTDNIENGNDNTPNHYDKVKDDKYPKNFQKWKEAILSAFKVMDKEVKLQENLDCSSSGTTAIVVIRQVNTETCWLNLCSIISPSDFTIHFHLLSWKHNSNSHNNNQGEGLVIANLGDSRAVLGTICDEELTAIQLTTDLKPGLPSKNLLITNMQLLYHILSA